MPILAHLTLLIAFFIIPNQEEIPNNHELQTNSHTNQDSPNKNPRTCKFYRKGHCKHGITGEECKFTHPEVCKKLTQHGTKQPRGCNKGSKCKYLHPVMCINSLRTGTCLSTNCRYRHVKGTTRHATNANANATQNARDAIATPKKNPVNQNNDTGSFLEAIRLLKAELLEEMDKRLKTVVSQVQKIQQPTNLPFNQHQGMQNNQLHQLMEPQQIILQHQMMQTHAFQPAQHILPPPNNNNLQANHLNQAHPTNLTINQAQQQLPIQMGQQQNMNY